MTFCGLVFTRKNQAITKDGLGLVHEQAINIIHNTFQRNWVQAITLKSNSRADRELFEQFKVDILSAGIRPGDGNAILSSMKSTARSHSSETFVAPRNSNDDIPNGHGVSRLHIGNTNAYFLVYPISATEVVDKEVDATYAIIKHCHPDKDINFYSKKVAEILCTADVPSSNTCSVWECDEDVIDNNHGNTKCQKHRKCYNCITSRAVRGRSDMCGRCTTETRKKKAEVTDDPYICCKKGYANDSHFNNGVRYEKCRKCNGWK